MKRQRPSSSAIAGTTATAIAVLSILLVSYTLWTGQRKVGDRVYGEHAVQGLDKAIELALNAYTDMVGLSLTAFGAVAFLVTIQQKKGANLGTRPWQLLGLALAALLGSLLFALLGREAVLGMIGNNSVDLGLGALTAGRWFTYGFLLAGASLLGFFALDVMLAPPPPDGGPFE